MSKHKAKRVATGVSLVGLGSALVAGVVAAFVIGMPSLLGSMQETQIKESVTSLARDFDEKASDRSPDTTVSGAFTGTGEVTLEDPKSKAVSKATFTLSDTDYLVTFDGKLDAYTITLDNQADDSDTVLIYDSITKEIK